MTNRKLRWKCWRITLALVTFIVTIVLVSIRWQWGPEDKFRKLIVDGDLLFVAVAAIWTIGPPLWFLLEYVYLYDENDPETTFEEFRYQQQLAAALWLGVMACLAAGWTIMHS